MNDPTFPHNIDNSMRKELVKCETAAKYKYEMDLRANTTAKVDLHAGKAFAAGMETVRRSFYVDAVDPFTALNRGIQKIYAEYGSFVAPEKSNKTADRMAGALTFYFAENPLMNEKLIPVTLNDGKRGIEVSFSFPMGVMHPDGEELNYCGTFDLLAQELATDDVWVVDEKTTGQMGDKWANQWFLDSQMTGYCWGSQKLLEANGLGHLQVKGAVINGIAIRLRDYEHQRLNVYRQQWEIDRWFRQMKSDVIRWREAHTMNLHSMALDHQCAMYNNPCEFAPLCSHRNPERIIENSYSVVHWNPITRTES